MSTVFVVLTRGLLTIALFLCVNASSQARGTFSNYYHTRWTVREGAPSGIRSIAQADDGYLWLGTDHGLFHFDGTSFESYRPVIATEALTRDIDVVAALPGGGLWIGYELGGASYLNHGRVTTWSGRDGLSPGTVRAFAKDADGRVWAATQYGLVRFDGVRWHDVGKHWTYPDEYPDNLFVDSRGTLWTSTRDGLLFLPRGQQNFHLADPHINENVDFSEAPDGTVWLASVTGSVRAITTPDGQFEARGPKLSVASDGLHVDREGVLWVTTVGKGVLRIASPEETLSVRRHNQSFEGFRAQNGLSGDFAFDAIEDREGSIWITTTDGLDQFRKVAFNQVQLPAGSTYISIVMDRRGSLLIGSNRFLRVSDGFAKPMPDGPEHIEAAYRDEDGDVWLGGRDGLWRLSGSHFFPQPLPAGLTRTEHTIQAITGDNSHALWVSFTRSGVYRLYRGAWTRSGGLIGLPDLPAISELTDSQDHLWLGYAGNLVARVDHGKVTILGHSDGIDVGTVRSLAEREGQVWIGGDNGLERLERGRFQRLNVADPETVRFVYGIATTPNGDLWLNMGSGVQAITGDELRRASIDPQRPIRTQQFDFLDGLFGGSQKGTPRPTELTTADGRVFFAKQGGVFWRSSTPLPRNPVPPPVWIESASADSHEFLDPSNATLPVHTHNLVFHYAATSLLIPKRVRFRYRLDPIDAGWQDGGTRRQAFYSRLPPGRYTFHVIACNNDGVWNETGASFGFSIPPSFFQSLLFRILCVLTATCALWLVYMLRLRQATEQIRSRLHERMAEREGIARDLHDTFLQGIQGLLLSFHTATEQLDQREPSRALLQEALRQSDQVMLEGRELVLDLRATGTETNDLPSALAAAGEEYAKTSASIFMVLVNGRTSELHPVVRDEIYRIGREALSNAFHHANALKIEVELTYGVREFRLRVRDDGAGIEPTILANGSRRDHWGLPGMRERAKKIGARLDVWSLPSAGTEIDLTMNASVAYTSKSKTRQTGLEEEC